VFSFSSVFPASKQRPRFYEKEELTHEEVDGGEEGEELRSAGPEGRTRGGGGEDRCHVKLRHDGGEECRGQIIQALRSGLATGFFELLPISSSLVIFCRLYRTCWFESCRRVCFDFPHVADFYWQYYIIKNNLNYIILENCLEYYICLRLPTIINEIIKLLYPC